jgi:hypothetical protein
MMIKPASSISRTVMVALGRINNNNYNVNEYAITRAYAGRLLSEMIKMGSV